MFPPTYLETVEMWTTFLCAALILLCPRSWNFVRGELWVRPVALWLVSSALDAYATAKKSMAESENAVPEPVPQKDTASS